MQSVAVLVALAVGLNLNLPLAAQASPQASPSLGQDGAGQGNATAPGNVFFLKTPSDGEARLGLKAPVAATANRTIVSDVPVVCSPACPLHGVPDVPWIYEFQEAASVGAAQLHLFFEVDRPMAFGPQPPPINPTGLVKAFDGGGCGELWFSFEFQTDRGTIRDSYDCPASMTAEVWMPGVHELALNWDTQAGPPTVVNMTAGGTMAFSVSYRGSQVEQSPAIRILTDGLDGPSSLTLHGSRETDHPANRTVRRSSVGELGSDGTSAASAPPAGPSAQPAARRSPSLGLQEGVACVALLALACARRRGAAGRRP